MRSAGTHALRLGAVLLAGAALRCSLVTDLDGLSGGSASASSTDASAPEAGTGVITQPDGSLLLRDTTRADFDAGLHSGTKTEADSVTLADGGAGRFRSRVHDAGREVTFVSLAWTPAAPYGKPLPNNAGRETGYVRDGLDMRGNVALFHFDGAEGPLTNATDTSGANNDGAAASRDRIVAGGVVGNALADDVADYVKIPVPTESKLNFGVADVTWAYWVRSTEDCPSANPPKGNRVHLGMEESGGNSTHVWLGCTSIGDACPAPDGTGRAGGTWCAERAVTEDCASFCGRTRINDGAWHHVVLVKRGHAPGSLRLFVDGKVDAPDTPIAFKEPIVVRSDTDFGVGGFSRGTFPAAGDFDEVAMWARALDDDEVGAVHRRATLRLSLRVRVCASADCSDDPPFVGGPAGVPFADPAGVPTPPAPAALAGLGRGRYIQYEAELSSATPRATPELMDVSIVARP
ncbi:MAG: LamG domain-containing protein [Myxococcales bacterium]|nr:LamG domain-containing protein [Myxococcales bacterium]